MSVIPLCMLPVRRHLSLSIIMEALHHGESEKQRTGEPDMLKEIMGPNFSKKQRKLTFFES